MQKKNTDKVNYSDRRRRLVDQLSRTNPRDAMHHGKRQNILNSHVTTTTPLLLVICHPVSGLDIPYLCTKFDDFRFSHSSDMIGAQKHLMGHMT